MTLNLRLLARPASCRSSRKKIEIGTFAATLIAAGAALAGDVESWANETFSPDGKNVIRLYANPLAYEVVRKGVTVVAKSEIGLTVDGARLDGEDATGLVPPVVKRGTRSGVADAPVYKKSKVDLSANEAFVDFGAWGVRLVARNDGVAYRFETKKSGKIRVDAEKASLHLPSADVKCWGYRTRAFGEEESGPFASKAGEIDLSKMMLYLPFAYEAGGKYVSVMESDVRNYTPGAMNNHGIGSGFRARDKRNQPGTLGTRCRQMAQVVLYEAPLQMLCDSPTNYEKNMECFAFMAKIPTVWKNTVGLAGTPDTMFVAARETRDGAWYAGGITTAEARDCTLDTSFLGAGEWAVEIFRDAGDAKEDAQRYVHETRKVKAGEKVPLHMAPGGGFVARCCRITPKSEVAEKPRKYLMGHGWDLLAVSPAEVARHADELSRTGLDGVSLSLRARLPDGRKFSFSSILTDPPWTREAFADQIPALKELHGKPGLSHCYLSAFWTPARRLRWDDDKAWALAIGNMKTLAQIAHEAQIEGLLIDPEDYSATKQFVFQNEDGDFDSTSRLARRRGGEFIDAVAAAHPRAKLLFFWLLSLSYHDFSGVADPQQFLKSRRDLWPAFVNGMLDRLPETMKLIDGDERAYRQEASRRDFYVAAWQQKQGMLPVVDVKNRDRFLLYTKGSQPSVSIYWKRNGSWNWSLPGCFPTIGEAGSDGWRQGEMFVRVPENADSFCLLLGAKQRADEQIWFDRVNVHPLD